MNHALAPIAEIERTLAAEAAPVVERRRMFHLSGSVSGLLKRNDKYLDGLFAGVPSGRRLSGREARAMLEAERANGVENLRLDPNCTSHDPKKGCQGCEDTGQ